MSSRTSAQPALPASEQAALDEPARSRKRTGLSRETLVVRALQVSLGLALLGLWQLAAAGKWPDPVLAKSPVQSWDYLAGAARSGALWSNTRSTMTAVLIAWVLASLAGVAAGLAATGDRVLVNATGPRPAPDLAVLRLDLDAAGLTGLDVRVSLVTVSYRPLPG